MALSSDTCSWQKNRATKFLPHPRAEAINLAYLRLRRTGTHPSTFFWEER